MEQNKQQIKLVSAKKTRYMLPNIITLIGVSLGITSIKYSLDGNFTMAVIFILIASLLDALDGRVARLIKGTSDFRKELDSLTDFVSFGIAPAFIIYFWELNSYGKIGWAIVLIFSICCVLRLARFNLTSAQSNEEWKLNYFEGIPSPAGAILILLPLIYEMSDFNTGLNLRFISPILTLIVAIMLISKLPTFSFKKISFKSSHTPFIFLIIGLALIGLIFYTFEALLVFGILYILHIPISLITYIRKNNLQKKFDDEEHENIL